MKKLVLDNSFSNKYVLLFLCLFANFALAQNHKKGVKSILPNNANIEWIIPANTIESSYSLCNIPDEGVFLLSNGVFVNPFSKETEFIYFPNEIEMLDAYWLSSDNCIISTTSSLLFCDTETGELTELLTSDKSNVHFDVAKTGIYYYYDKDASLYHLSFNDLQTSICYKVDGYINDIKSDGDNCFIAFDNKIAILSDDHNFIPLLKTKETINSIELGVRDMVFVGTDSCLYYFDDNLQTIPIIKTGVKDMLFVSDSLFTVFSDNSAAVISNISDFQSASDSLLSYKKEHPSTSTGHTLQLLNENSSSDFTSMKFGTFPYHGLYGVMSNSVVGMDMDRNEELEELALPDTIHIDEFVFLRECSVFKSGEVLFTMDKDLKLHKHTFDTDAFSIEMQTDSTLLLYYGGSVFEYNPIADDLKRLICLGDEHIVDCTYSNNESFFVVTDEYVVMKKDGKLHPLAKLQEKIAAADITPQGFFIGTVKGLYELTEFGEVIQLLDQPISQILDDWEVTYIITTDGKIFRCGLSS